MPTDLQTTDPTRDDHLPWTGERFLPEMSGETALEHLHRYFLAAEHATSKYVLDIASGEGYGSFVLAQSASQVYAVDVSEEAIRHAKRKYQRDNLRFIVGSCAAIPLSDASVDLIVSFETIEHHDQHIEMMRECTRVLKPDGLLIISSPDKYEYSIVPGTSNPFHAKELTTGEFADLLSGHFSSIKMFGQRVRYASMIGPATTEPTPSVTYESVQGILNRYPGFGRPHYVIAFASNRPLPDVIAAGLFYSPEIYPHLQEYTDLVAVTADLRTDQLQLRAQVEAAETVRDHVLQERSKIEEQLNLVLSTVLLVKTFLSSPFSSIIHKLLKLGFLEI